MGFIGWITSKKVLSFLGGVATATIGVKILKSAPVRNAAVKTIAAGMKLQQDAMSTFEAMKEDAQDLCYEARQQAEAAEETEEETVTV